MPAPGVGARIEAMTGAHAAAVLAIYQAGIEEGNATFETLAPDWAAFPAPARRRARRSARPPGACHPAARTESRRDLTGSKALVGVTPASAGRGQARRETLDAVGELG